MAARKAKPRSVVSLACIAAVEAPIVVIVARYLAHPRWTCILKWDVERQELVPGAWTKLRIKTRSCRLTPDGAFWMYAAEGGPSGAFDRRFGGGNAIARPPWLAALTQIRPHAIAVGGQSRHALPKEQQDRLWNLFRNYRGYYQSQDWPLLLGHAWRRTKTRYAADVIPWQTRSRRVRMVAAAEISNSQLRLTCVVDRVARGDDTNDRPRFFLDHNSEKEVSAPRELAGICWAMPWKDGRITVATVDGQVQRLRVIRPDDPKTKLRVESEHDLSRLKPKPGPAPREATAPFK